MARIGLRLSAAHLAELESTRASLKKERRCWLSGVTRLSGRWDTRSARPWQTGMPITNSEGWWRWTIPYLGARKPGKPGRGASGKAAVIVSVENRGKKAGFAKMRRVDKVDAKNIRSIADDRVEDGTVTRTDGLHAYWSLKGRRGTHEHVIVGTGKDASRLLPWVHTLLANLKGNI